MAEAVKWTFYGWVAPNGRRDVQAWFDRSTDDERDEVTDGLVYLQALPFSCWKRPEFENLGSGLSELRFKVNALNQLIRIYGCFWPRGGLGEVCDAGNRSHGE